MTLRELGDAYATWTDADHSPFIRLVEAAFREGKAARLRLKEDRPETDAMAIMMMQKAIKARRQARVPRR